MFGFSHRDDGSTEMAMTDSGSYNDGAWHTFVCSRISASSWVLFMDGASVATSSTSGVGTTTTDNQRIGAYSRTSTILYSDDDVAEVATLSDDFTLSDAQAFDAGFGPHIIKNQSLLNYWKLAGDFSPEPDFSGNANNGTLTGTAKANHPPIQLMTDIKMASFTQDVVAGGSVPIFYHHYTKNIGAG